ncbi:MAG: nicotinate-nucleotide pyrophosphorylase [Alicyclobacillaceae bacterium]|nr:nicotinate-nucleotide pyrophosphorylase [Alicyclobacillaceae bacterium]
MTGPAVDLRDTLFSPLQGRTFTARVIANGCGVVAGGSHATALLAETGCELLTLVDEGTVVAPGDIVMEFQGPAKGVALAEDRVLGAMMMPSGYATRARQLQQLAGQRLRVVCGGWKKLPQGLKSGLHAALAAAGVGMRLVDDPFVYMDKNYIRMFGGISEALRAAAVFPDRMKVVQLRGDFGSVADEAREAVEGGADVLMIDTGDIGDIRIVDKVVQRAGKKRPLIAFAGGVTAETLLVLNRLPVDIVDVGAAILDAPMLDMRMEVDTAGLRPAAPVQTASVDGR